MNIGILSVSVSTKSPKPVIEMELSQYKTKYHFTK